MQQSTPILTIASFSRSVREDWEGSTSALVGHQKTTAMSSGALQRSSARFRVSGSRAA